MSRTKNVIRQLRGWTTPVPHYGKSWYVDYYAYNPYVGDLCRKKHHVPMSLKVNARKALLSELVAELTESLKSGWNPWYDTNAVNSYQPLSKGLDEYEQYARKMDRENTVRDYTSRLNIFRTYISSLGKTLVASHELTTAFCVGFLDWLVFDRKVTPTTRNNYRRWLFGLSNFLMLHGYIKENPVEPIPLVPKSPRLRKDLSESMLARLSDHLVRTDKWFLLACMMEYYTLIRPGELCELKVGDVSVMNMSIRVSGDFSKNHKDAFVGLNTKILKLMIELGMLSKPASFYLFGSGMMTCAEKGNKDQFNRRWLPLRKAFGWSDKVQFYSLKYSGIRDLANAEGVVVARDQARHKDIATTNKYIEVHKAHECTKHFKGAL